MFAKLLITSLTIATSVVAHPTVVRRGDVSLADWQSQNLEVSYSILRPDGSDGGKAGCILRLFPLSLTGASRCAIQTLDALQ